MRNKILKHCRICFSKKLVGYLDLGKQPFSNSFLSFKDIKKDSATKTAKGAIKFKFNIRISDKSDSSAMPGLMPKLKGGG